MVLQCLLGSDLAAIIGPFAGDPFDYSIDECKERLVARVILLDPLAVAGSDVVRIGQNLGSRPRFDQSGTGEQSGPR